MASNEVQARAYEDPSDPAGGQIVVVLQDIVRTPVPCAFRLTPPGQAESGAAPSGWPAGEMLALDTRTTRSGVELVLGAEVGEHAALVPGTAVELALSGTRIRARFTWPEMAAGRSVRRRNITLVPSRRPAKAAPVAAAWQEAAKPGPSRQAIPITESGAAAPEKLHEPPGRPSGSSSEEKPAMSPAPSIFDKLAALDAIAETAEAPVPEPAAPPARPSSDKVKALPQDGARRVREAEAPAVAPAQPAADPVVAMLAELKRDIAQIKHEQAASLAPREEQQLYGLLADLRRDIELLKRHEAGQEQPPGERQLYGMLADLRRDIETLKRHEAEVALPPGERQLYGMLAELRRDIEVLKHHETAPPVHSGGDAHLYGMLAELRRDIQVLKEHEAEHAPPSPERQLYAMLSELKRDIHILQEQGHDAPAPRRAAMDARGHGGGIAAWLRAQTEGQSPLSLAAMALVPVLLALVLTSTMSGRNPAPAPAPAPVAQSPVLPPLATAPSRPGEPGIASPVFDALAAGPVSPRGVHATGMPASEILARINAERQAGRGRLGAEGEYWMRRYLMVSLGDGNSARVLTQLGSLHAESGAAADYGKARQLWEVAGALGDPVAMCFLGSLYDSGLGVAADRRTAMQWYERARDAGGCAGAERIPGR